MDGAREFARLFETGQYGRMYIVSGSHARGKTFHIQILPKDEEAIPNGKQNLCINKNAVEVYGVIGGHPGWTERYGWIHKGKWVDDFQNMVNNRTVQVFEEISKAEKLTAQLKEQEMKRVKLLLNNY